MEQVTLPADLSALFVVLSNPLIAPVWLSMILEQIPFIKNPATADWKKVGASILAGLIWAVFIAIGNPDSGFAFSGAGVYSILKAGLGVAFVMNLFNQSVYNAFPWLKDFLLVLFQRTTVTSTATVKTESGETASTSSSTSKTTVSAGTTNTAKTAEGGKETPILGDPGVSPDNLYVSGSDGFTIDQG